MTEGKMGQGSGRQSFAESIGLFVPSPRQGVETRSQAAARLKEEEKQKETASRAEDRVEDDGCLCRRESGETDSSPATPVHQIIRHDPDGRLEPPRAPKKSRLRSIDPEEFAFAVGLSRRLDFEKQTRDDQL